MVTLTDLADEYGASLQVEGKSPRTVETYTRTLRTFLAYLPEEISAEEVTPRRVREYLAQRKTQVSESTVAQEASRIGCFFKWLIREEEIERNPLRNIKPARPPAKPVATITLDDLTALIESLSGSQLQRPRRELSCAPHQGQGQQDSCGSVRTQNRSGSSSLPSSTGQASAVRPRSALAD